MKKIIAYIRKEKADITIEKLEAAGVNGMTIIDANALAKWADKKYFSYSIEYVEKYSRVIKLELVCNNEDSDMLVNLISKYAHTGQSGDGWAFVSTIDKAVRIKTGLVNDYENL
ncbi:MAG: P-II family nitrogen regulator [Ignavibacteriales bacterium CG12_big_fil_rev_8_21_14_0_65_30_8]|nr:MAG: P-II family nitrogen regulator [Ignavibacteriales bacterium CG12_big_fil_rev_8_21_14_0_65_30_8]